MILKSLGEALGTFILVGIGCSSVAVSTLELGLPELWQVALVWGIGVAFAIYISRIICLAHLNPAVSLALFLEKKITLKELKYFIVFQLLGAIAAGVVVFVIFNPMISSFENLNAITRGEQSSMKTARIFGEFFETSGDGYNGLDVLKAILSEATGTFLLVLVILKIGKTRRKIGMIAPMLIGLTISILIVWLAPISQGGFNPARDFGPRLVAYFAGWNQAAFPPVSFSFLTVYIIGPFLGGMAGSLVFSKLIKSRN